MSEHDLERRVEELESQLAFQDELHAQLNKVVARQDRELALLIAQVEVLAARLKDLGDTVSSGPGDSGDEAPPHY
ncbi:MAG: SlyX family protein [Xanthomonadales bacterium]|nr:SlyX family protein [Xanthomonadales bacterium]